MIMMMGRVMCVLAVVLCCACGYTMTAAAVVDNDSPSGRGVSRGAVEVSCGAGGALRVRPAAESEWLTCGAGSRVSACGKFADLCRQRTARVKYYAATTAAADPNDSSSESENPVDASSESEKPVDGSSESEKSGGASSESGKAYGSSESEKSVGASSESGKVYGSSESENPFGASSESGNAYGSSESEKPVDGSSDSGNGYGSSESEKSGGASS
ncbi:uncharacterized protein TM35_000103120, partial [Trypanosoma theileri]